MLNGAFALLERSLRIDARGWSTHLARLGLMAAIYISLCFALTTQDMFGAPGLRFFRWIAYLDAVFMTLLGLGFFSTSITVEKEEDTLGLMLMAGISPLGILTGKSGGRLWQALLLVAVQFPFMLLAVTMGGVTTGQIWSVMVALLAYMVFLAGLGLLCSTLAPNSRAAGSRMIIGLAVYFLIPYVSLGILQHIPRTVVRGTTAHGDSETWRVILEIVSQVCVFLRLGEVLTTGFSQSAWSVQVVSNLALGTVCAGLSWLLFGMATRNPSTEATSRGLVAHRRAFFRFSAGRPKTNPFIWKDFHFVAGGIGTMLVRAAYYSGLFTAVMMYCLLTGSTIGLNGALGFCLMLLSFSVAIDAAIVLSRAIHDEIRGQTLASLLMLPRSSTGMLYSKFFGSLLGWLPGPVILLAITLCFEEGQKSVWSILTNENGGWCVVMLFAMIPHFAPLVALYVRWGSVPIAIGMTIGVYIAIVCLLSSIGPVRSQDQMETALLIATIVLICVCVACHVGIVLRVQALGAR